MRILLDHCVPKRLKRLLTGHSVNTAYEMGWAELKNGKLLDEAAAQFDVLLTVDRNMPFQQNLGDRPLSILVIAARDNRFETLIPYIPYVEKELASVGVGEVILIEIPA